MKKSLRTSIRKRLAAKRAERVEPSPPPRYDEVFFENTRKLNEIARGLHDRRYCGGAQSCELCAGYCIR